jgi:citronellol/citronellal dehydrogenase
MSLAGKTLFITGASRGIGLAIGLRAARDGANVAIAAKTAEPHPKLAGTIYTAAKEIERAGGKALPLVVDVRDEVTVKEALDKTAAHFGGIDIVVNNASAIQLTPVVSDRHEAVRPHAPDQRARHVCRLEMGDSASRKGGKPAHPHDLAAARHEGEMVRAAYRLQHGQVRHEPGRARACRRAAPKGIAVNALWPRTVIATAAVQNLLGGDA